MSVFASECQAERAGAKETGGVRNKHFTVFQYEQPRTRLTLFGYTITATGKSVTVA